MADTNGYTPRGITATVLRAMAAARVVALLGPRQAGKSTLARRLAAEHLGARYITLDDDAIRDSAETDPARLIADLPVPLVIDEVQRAPGLLLAIKRRVDVDNARGQYLLTGSANLRRIPTVADNLPGRVDYLSLWPFTQSEIEGRIENRLFENLFEGKVPDISDAPVGRRVYADRILKGGFPEAGLREGSDRLRFFSDYVGSLLDRDVAETSNVKDPDITQRLMRLMASRTAGLANYESLGSDLEIDGKTAKAHLEVLERLFLIRIQRPWHTNLGKRQMKPPKLYVSDTGLIAGELGIDSERLIFDDELAGKMFETFAVTELERLASWHPEPLSFWHYREGRREVDMIIERPSGELIGVEIKAGATLRSRDFAPLRYLRKRLGERMVCGIVLHTGERTMPYGDDLWAVPLEALWDARD